VALTAGIPTIAHHERADYARELDLLREQRRLLAQVSNAILLNARVYLTLILSAILLARISPLLLLLPPFGLGALWTGRKANQIREAARETNAERWRLRAQLKELATSAVAAKELRLFGLGDEILRRHHTVAREAGRETDRAAWKGTALAVLGSLLFAAGYIGAIALVLVRAVAGHATAGDVVLAISLAAQLDGSVAAIVDMGNYLGRAARAGKRYLWLLDYARQVQPAPVDPAPVPERLRQGIDLEHVSFRYPGTDAPVLTDLSLHLPGGTMVALVGDNGAGKSTLVKLLCCLYHPDAGRIRVDGVDSARFDVRAWRARLSAGFQDFCKFEFLARESVGVGDLSLLDSETAVRRAIARGGAEDVVTALPLGLETPLGKNWAGGVELSVGQWQKLALARASMRQAPLLLILDEPTAAIDAPTEYALFERFRAAARRGEMEGAITLVVSHRFSTVRMADLIVVLDGGRIRETGSHDELMRHDGLYAELYRLQAKAYR
jgi:ATP-binding cassette, subfamily B, bacterial